MENEISTDVEAEIVQAVEKNDLTAVAQLIEFGVDLDPERKKYYFNPLQIAIDKGYLEMV